MRSGVWRGDWFLGLAVAILFALFGWMSDLLPGLERKAYDLLAIAPQLLAQAKARAVGYLICFSEPENERINRTLGEVMDAAGPESPSLGLLKEAG